MLVLSLIIYADKSCGTVSSQKISTKRIRTSSTSSVDPKENIHLPPPFQQLECLNVHLNSPAHLPIFQYIISFSKSITSLVFEQFYADYEESLIITTLFSWNNLEKIEELRIVNGANLSLHTLNEVIHNCPNLRRIGKISSWGKIGKHQLETIKNEIKLRNFDLAIDDEVGQSA